MTKQVKNKKTEKIVVVQAPPAKKNKQKRSRNTSVTMPKSSETTMGGDLGNFVGKGFDKLSTWLGFGAYTIKKNSIIGAGGSIPSMHSSKDSVIVRHREYVGAVNTSTGFVSSSLSMNPGLETTYPWLSKMAQNYQQYKILGAVVSYVPLISEVSANEISLGQVVLAANYRTDLPTYPNIAAALESEFAVATKPNCPVELAIECDPAQSPYRCWYVRTSTVPSGEDVKTFDFAEFSVITEGFQTANVVAGQIWISYEIELLRPTAYLDPPQSTFGIHIGSSSITNSNPVANPGITSYFNPESENLIGATATQQHTQDGGAFANPSAGVFQYTMPRGLTGEFAVLWTCAGVSGGSAILDSTFSLTNGTIVKDFQNANSGVAPSTASTTTTRLSYWCWFSISDTQASTGQCVLSMGGNTTVVLGGAAVSDVYITQIVPGF